MSGTSMGRIKAKLGLKGPTKPGDMMRRMNEMKTAEIKKEMKVEITKPISNKNG